jgi:hypothetical protein
MNYDNFKTYFHILEQAIKNSDALSVALVDDHGITSKWDIFIESYMKLFSDACDDDANWISWYVYENDMGKAGLKAKASSKYELKPVRTVKQLYDLIERSKLTS